MIQIHRMRLKANRGRGYRIVRIGRVEGVSILPQLYSVSELRDRNVEYVIVSSTVAATFTSGPGRKAYPVQAQFYSDLEEKAQLIQVFHPSKGRTPGPRLAVYSLKENVEMALRKVGS
jgi:hypothetical protein